jgi:general secretion pathway protein G
MTRRIRSGERLSRREFGFTLIELMIVMTIISILLAIAVPIYQKSILRAKESVLRNNLFTLRTMIDEYTVDKEHAPQSLDDLVSDGYLRQVPVDPITGNNQTWKTIMEDTPAGGDNQQPGIFDVKSGAEGNGLDGTPYADW